MVTVYVYCLLCLLLCSDRWCGNRESLSALMHLYVSLGVRTGLRCPTDAWGSRKLGECVYLCRGCIPLLGECAGFTSRMHPNHPTRSSCTLYLHMYNTWPQNYPQTLYKTLFDLCSWWVLSPPGWPRPYPQGMSDWRTDLFWQGWKTQQISIQLSMYGRCWSNVSDRPLHYHD